jgi:hypothetical protein
VKRLIGLLLVVGLALPTQAGAAPAEVTPESTSAARFSVEQDGQQLISTGSLQAASDLYWAKGFELRDPVLIVAAAEQLRDLADRDRSIPAAQQALERLTVAFDMLYYLRDSATSASWQPITSDQVAIVLARADRVSTEAQTLIAAIEAEVAAAAAAPEPDEKTRRGKAKPGTVLIASGATLLVIGLGVGGGLGAAGLWNGAAAQKRVEHPLVYAKEHAEADLRGRQSNIMAGVGLAIAGVGVIAGAALLVIGVEKRKAAGAGSSQAMVPTPVWLRGGAGVGVAGRF